MAKYRPLIDQLDGPNRSSAYEQLIDADGRAHPALVHALLNHASPDVRHDVAEILGKRKHWKAIPALITALDDDCLFVRHDAIWSIEKICMLQPEALTTWLDPPADLVGVRPLVTKWWDANRQFIENNDSLT